MFIFFLEFLLIQVFLFLFFCLLSNSLISACFKVGSRDLPPAGGAGAEDFSDDHEDIYDEERKKPKRLRPPPNSTMWSNVPIGPSQELNVAGLGSIGGTGASTAVAAAVAESDSDDDEFAALAQRHDRSHVLMQRLDQLFAESAIGAPPPGEG